MRLTVHEFVTLDGVMQGPGGPGEDTSGGFAHGGWVVPYADESFGRIVDSWFARTTAVLFGRGTYDLMAPYWVRVTDPENVVAVALNGLPKYVVSSTLTDPSWANTTVLPADDVVAAVAGIKEARPDGELQVHGSHRLVRTLHDAGLVDEYRLMTFPIVLGAGKRLFDEATVPSGFVLTGSQVTPAGVTYSEYLTAPLRPGGEFVIEDGDVTRESP